MSHDISLDMATLIGMILEIFMYGLYVVLFFGTVWAMRYRSSPLLSPFVWLAVTTLFILATTHVAISVRRLINGFVIYRNLPGGPGCYFSDQSAVLNIIQLSVYWIITLVGDSLVVWRCWVLWTKKWWILLFYGILLASLAACGINTTIAVSNLGSSKSVFETAVAQWAEAFLSISLATNVIVSAMISYRLYSTGKRVGLALGPQYAERYWRLLWIFLESGTIYPIAIIIYMVTYIADIDGHSLWVIYPAIVQIVAIVPCLMVVTLLAVSYRLSPECQRGSGPHFDEPSSRFFVADHDQPASITEREDGLKLRSLSPEGPRIIVDITQSTITSFDVERGMDESG